MAVVRKCRRIFMNIKLLWREMWVSELLLHVQGRWSMLRWLGILVRSFLLGMLIYTFDVCISVFYHHEIVLASIKSGKDVLMEKTLAVTVRAGRRVG